MTCVQRWKLFLCGAALLTIGVWAGRAEAGGAVREQRDVYWWHSGDARVHTVEFKRDCLEQEDSAAHLVLRDYGAGTAVFGCERGGY